MSNFTERFLAGFQAGQNSRLQKEDLEYRGRQEQRQKVRDQWDTEDRDIEKQLLQHRMRELKIAEKLNARELARQNIDLMEGTPADQIPFDAAEEDRTALPDGIPNASTQPVSPFRMKQMSVPGIEELGVGAVSRRPQTLEQQLAAQFAQARIKALTTPYTLTATEGGTSRRMVGDEVVGEVSGSPKLVPFTTRDKKGVESTEYITPEERARRGPAVRNPLPRQSSTTVILPQEAVTSNAEGIIRGLLPPELGNSRSDMLIKAELAKKGFDLSAANLRLRAMRQATATLNSDQRANLRVAADRADASLTELKELAQQWDAGGFGIWNATRLAAAKKGTYGEKAQELATNLEGAISSARTAVAQLRSGGSQTANKAIDEATALLDPNKSAARLSTTIDRLQKDIQYTTNAIRNLEAITPGEGGGAGATRRTDAGSVPEEVVTEFANEEVGTEIDFSDGSTWKKTANGIVKIK